MASKRRIGKRVHFNDLGYSPTDAQSEEDDGDISDFNDLECGDGDDEDDEVSTSEEPTALTRPFLHVLIHSTRPSSLMAQSEEVPATLPA